MENANHLILLGSVLVLLSIFAGQIFTRIGAPLLLVFLGLGMLAGEDGVGGLHFDDFDLTFLTGNVALALILFDGGLRTSRATFRLAAAPAVALATIGVALTAVIVGFVAAPLLGLDLTQGMLMGAIVASTDAAAVFMLLNRQNTAIERRVGATLQVESGFNDPMAVFLTVALVMAVQSGHELFTLDSLILLTRQLIGGLVVGLGAGFGLLWVVNRVTIASGLYPILVATFAVFSFAVAQAVHGSGFLAVYLTGLVFGFGRHRARQLIERFHEGLAWLSQITMFLLLGLLVTPSKLLPDLLPALGVAGALILLARPAAVLLCLLPFRFNAREIVFSSWVGLRGAVPIFLATIPVVAGLPDAATYYNIAFVVVITSLLLQGWTIMPVARWLGLLVPAAPDGGEQIDLGTPPHGDRDLLAYKVGVGSNAVRKPYATLGLPNRARVLAVLRGNSVLPRDGIDKLSPADTVLMLAPPETTLALYRLFAPEERRHASNAELLGDFLFDAGMPARNLTSMYGLPIAPDEAELPLGDLLRKHLGHRVVVGDRVNIGPVQFIVAEMTDSKIMRVGMALQRRRPPAHNALIRTKWRWRRFRRRIRRMLTRKTG